MFFCKSFFLIITIIVLIIHSLVESGRKNAAPLLFIDALRFNVTMSSPPNLSQSISTSPRRIVLDITVNFSIAVAIDTVPSPKVNITLPNENYVLATNYKVRNASWFNVGSYDSVSRSFAIQIMSPVDSYNTTEQNAFDALSSLIFDFSSVSEQSILNKDLRPEIDVNATIQLSYRRIREVMRDSTSRFFQASRTFCENSGTGRFLMEFLRPYERDAILPTLSTAYQWWVSVVMVRQTSPYNSFYCMNYSFDYDPSQCKIGGAYAQGYVEASTNAYFCSRPSGFSCLTGTWNEYTIPQVYNRLTYDPGASTWIINDIGDNPGYEYGTVCFELSSYNTTFSVNRTIAIGNWTTKSHSITPQKSSSISISHSASRSSSAISFTDSVSSLRTVSPSTTQTFTETDSSTLPPTPTRSNSSTLSRKSSSPSSSQSASQSNTTTRPPTRSRSISNSRKISRSTASSSFSESISQKSPTSDSSQSVLTSSSSISSAHLPTLSKPRTVSFSQNSIKKLVKPTPALNDVQNAIMILSVASGVSAVATSRARLEAALQLSRCGKGEDLNSDLDALDNPLGLKFGTGILQSQRGAAFGNVFVVVAFGTFLTIVALVVMYGSERTFWSAMQRVRMPGILILVMQIISPGTTAATSALWMYGQFVNDATLSAFSSITVVFGPLILVLLVTLPRQCKSRLYHLPTMEEMEESKLKLQNGNEEKISNESNNNNNNNSQEETDPENSNNNSNSSHSCRKRTPWKHFYKFYAFFLVPKQDWFDRDMPPPTRPRERITDRGDETERGLSGFTLKYGVVYEDFDRPIFAFYDLLMGNILGAASGFAVGFLSRPYCLFLLALATLTCGSHACYLLYYRPCLTRLMQMYLVANSLFTFVTVFLSTLVFLGETLNLETVASTMLDVQTTTSIFTVALQVAALFVFFYETFEAFFRKELLDLRRRERGESRTKVQTFSLEDILLNNNENNELELEIRENDRQEIHIDESDFVVDIETQLQNNTDEIDLDAILNEELDDNDEDDDEEIEIDLSSLTAAEEEKKRVAERANAEQHEELKRMLTSKTK